MLLRHVFGELRRELDAPGTRSEGPRRLARLLAGGFRRRAPQPRPLPREGAALLRRAAVGRQRLNFRILGEYYARLLGSLRSDDPRAGPDLFRDVFFMVQNFSSHSCTMRRRCVKAGVLDDIDLFALQADVRRANRLEDERVSPGTSPVASRSGDLRMMILDPDGSVAQRLGRVATSGLPRAVRDGQLALHPELPEAELDHRLGTLSVLLRRREAAATAALLARAEPHCVEQCDLILAGEASAVRAALEAWSPRGWSEQGRLRFTGSDFLAEGPLEIRYLSPRTGRTPWAA